jgi:hypothetical protein
MSRVNKRLWVQATLEAAHDLILDGDSDGWNFAFEWYRQLANSHDKHLCCVCVHGIPMKSKLAEIHGRCTPEGVMA